MWLAALAGLMVGGPLGVCMVLAAGIMQFVKVREVDAQFAKRGELPPSARLIERWLNRRQQAGKKPIKPAKYGMWRYGWLRWLAFWEDLTERFQQVRADYKQAIAAARANGQPLPPKPTVKETLTGWQWNIGQTGPGVAQPATAAAPTPPASSDDDPFARFTPNPGPDGETRPHPRRPSPVTGARAGTVPTPPSPTSEENPMAQAAQQSGEVTGIPSAIHYLEQMAAAHHDHGDQENLITSMSGMQMGAADIGLVQAAMQKSLAAAAAYTTAANSIAKNNDAVRQGYASAPDAADKRYQMAE